MACNLPKKLPVKGQSLGMTRVQGIYKYMARATMVYTVKAQCLHGHFFASCPLQICRLDFAFIFLWPCPWLLPVLAGWVYGFVVLCQETGSGSGFKVSQKTEPRSSDSSGEAGNETCNPCLRNIGLSPTPRQLLWTLVCIASSE